MSMQSSYHLQSSSSTMRKKDNENQSDSSLPLMTLFTRVTDVYSSMQNIRIIQKHLVYLIGLSNDLANKNILLCGNEYLGQYGKVTKLVINKNKTYNTNGPNGPSYSCHATFASYTQSSLAILALDNAVVDNHVFKASFGTTKYCTNFLRNSLCLNRDCLYLHALADDKDIISRHQMNGNKSLFANQHVMAIEMSEVLSERTMNELEQQKDRRSIFPNPYTVYNKDIVIEYQRRNVHANVKKTKSKECLSIVGLDKLYQRKTESRFFNAVNGNNVKEIIDVPCQVSDFLSVNFARSILFQKEQDEVSQYYFSRRKAHEAEDDWKTLLVTLELLTAYDQKNTTSSSHINKLTENDSCVLVEKYHSV